MASKREHAREIVEAAIVAADPYASVKRALSLDGEVLRIDSADAPLQIALEGPARVYVVGCGKAGTPMALAIEDLIGDSIVDGVVTVKYGHVSDRTPARIRIVEAGHPTPDKAGSEGAQAALDLLDRAGRDDLVIALISGGGSALWPQPVADVSLEDKQDVTALLLACGADIHEINCVRKHLSAIKGGRAARHAAPATVLALVISDVIGDDLDTIASGPFVPDTTTFARAWAVVEKYGIEREMPLNSTAYLASGVAGQHDETPKLGDPAFDRVTHVLCATNALALTAAGDKARAFGYEPLFWEGALCGEARIAAERFCQKVDELRAARRQPFALIAGGETTVALGDCFGKGGRNQELALAAAIQIATPGLTNSGEDVVVVSCGTDGNDGPTDAAGAIVDSTTVSRAARAGFDSAAALAGHDAYPLLDAIGDLLVTGPTNTNVMDVQVALVG